MSLGPLSEQPQRDTPPSPGHGTAPEADRAVPLAGGAALARFLVEHGRDVLWRTTADGLIRDVSATVQHVLGYGPEELVGRSLDELTHPDDRIEGRRSLSASPSGEEHRPVLLRTRRKDGSYVWLERVVTPLGPAPQAGGLEVLLTTRDVTDRRLGMLAMAESERRFRATFEQAAVGVAHLALDGRWLRVNQRLCETLGYSREAFLGLDLNRVLHPDDVEGTLASLASLRTGALATYRTEVRAVDKRGRTTWVNLTASLVRRDNGAPDYFLTVIEDITERKRSEGELASARRELAQMEKLSALGSLVGGVAHEVRTPLAYAGNHLRWIQMRLEKAKGGALTPAEVAELETSLAEALNGLDRINRLVQDLRRFVQRDSGQIAIAQLNDVVQDALDLFRATHRSTHTIEPELRPLPLVAVDRVQIQQVVLNLLENAADAMPYGGPIRVTTLDSPEGIEIHVTDRGAGIPPEAQPRIFDPLFTTKAHGMGLGLSIVKRLVEGHHGRIAFTTAPGAGTTFRILLPRPQTTGGGPTPP